MESDIKNKLNDCPQFEDLSAWYDQELPDNDLNLHIKNCENCRQLIADFKSYNELICKNLATDYDIIQQIQKNCIKEITKANRDNKSIISFPIWIKVAACLLLCAIFITLRETNESILSVNSSGTSTISNESILQQTPSLSLAKNPANKQVNSATLKSPTANTATVNDSHPGNNATSSIAASLPSSIKDHHSEFLAKAKKNRRKHSLDLANISLVGFGLSQNRLNTSKRQSKMHMTENNEINDYVHHVWVVDNPSKPLESLKTLLPNHAAMLEKLINKDQNRYHLQFKVTDNNLINLVNHFDELGFKLLSPGAPQPGSAENNISSMKVIRYDVDFVKE